MTTKFIIGASSIAFMASVATGAHAQDMASFDLAEAQIVDTTSALDNTGANASGVVTLQGLTPLNDAVNPYYRNIDPFYRDINPFYRDINPFYRDINPFWRDISPFYRNISAFWGDINAFYRDISAFDAAALQGVADFWVHTSGTMAQLNEAWAAYTAGDLTRGDEAVALLNQLYQESYDYWNPISLQRTGKDFDRTVATRTFQDWGVYRNSAATLWNTSDEDRVKFLLAWHDRVMTLAGIDHPDHWMAAINWTPKLTQLQGKGADTVIGIIDSNFGDVTDLNSNVIWAGGSTNTLSGHGVGVASLIAAAHDQKGAMGIAPNVKIAAYNPFSVDGTATWDDVATGIRTLKLESNFAAGGHSASIINMSLGERGFVLSPEAARVFARPDVAQFSNNTVYVMAAGNDGISQKINVDWDFSKGTSVIFVGSINPVLESSSFSNKPGEACLLDKGVCYEENKLYRRTVVAPGEILLVDSGDWYNPITRVSGTSFAAPLVSGTIALLHDRWPWLAQHPKETADIIFQTAHDLGAPGPDPIYGWGLLDVTASQSVINFNKLQYMYATKKGKTSMSRYKDMTAQSLLSSGVQASWETDKAFLTVFENIGTTYRDFDIPLSTTLYGTQVPNFTETFQDYIAGRFFNWLKSGGTDTNGDGLAGLTDARLGRETTTNGWSLRFEAMAPSFTDNGTVRPTHTAATLTNPNGKMSFTMGYGQGAMSLAGSRFGIMTDHDALSGGVNPVLGFASGESFASAAYKLSPNTKVTFGFTENRTEIEEFTNTAAKLRVGNDAINAYEASAVTVSVEQKLSKRLKLAGEFTRLREKQALLGIQTTLGGGLDKGTTTTAMTASAAYDAPHGISFDLSATAARTDSKEQAFTTGDGVFSTAAQFAVTKQGLIGKRDKLRLSVAQPLNVEDGTIEFSHLAVIDRQTGERGTVTQTFDIDTKRRVVGEAIYAAPIKGNGELGIFARYENEDQAGNTNNYTFGGSLRIGF